MSGNCRFTRHQWSDGTCQCCGARQCAYERDGGHRCRLVASGTEVRGVAKSPLYCAAHGYMLAGGRWSPHKTRHNRPRTQIQ